MQIFTKSLLKTFVLAATCFVCQTASAQTYYNGVEVPQQYENKNFKLGLSVNPNLGWLRFNENDYDTKSKLGFSYGLLADIGFNQNYYFSTGLLINSIAAEYTSPEPENQQKSVRLQYVDIPLTLKLKTAENSQGRYYGQFGFTTGFKVSGREQLAGSTKKTSIDGDNFLRLGLQIGGGKEWKVSQNINIMTGLSFNNGFTRAFKDGKPKNSYAALNVGVFF